MGQVLRRNQIIAISHLVSIYASDLKLTQPKIVRPNVNPTMQTRFSVPAALDLMTLRS